MKVRLAHKRENIYYKKDPVNPVFECHLDPDLMQNLITDPSRILKKKSAFFWLKMLVHGIFTGGQFIFETFPPQDTSTPQVTIAARTLFQLDGDMLLKINEHMLTRMDGMKILDAHSRWTTWCFEQLISIFALKREFFLTFPLRYLLKFLILTFLVRAGMHRVRKQIKQIL